ncbi:MAG: T9SS type A sorting domain-containing protein [Bacteroidetes bacterium]|nr:T9SS type A sorting domain-containing protein [Bacteroidota bacterium]MBU1115014.1 T9SS type A sorting domain-containing protein [Bacteroidota bacterium]MBU1799506.1 T9SS type A sorting domain-containing protein [Bacteroidota bacterium]
MKLLKSIFLVLFISNACNAQWQKSTLDIEHTSGVMNFNDKVIVGTSGDGIYYSTTDEETWVKYSNEFDSVGDKFSVYKFYQFEDLYACTDVGLFRLSKGEENWEYLNQGKFRAFYKGDGYLLSVPIDGEKLLRSTDDGHTWEVIDSDWTYAFMTIINYKNSLLGAHDKGLYQSFDKGLTWIKIDDYSNTFELKVSDNKIYRATNSGILISEGNIDEWTNIGPSAQFINDFTVFDDLLIISGYNNGLVCKNKNSNGWVRSDLGLKGDGVYEVKATNVIGDKVFTTNNSGLWIRDLNDFYIPQLEVTKLVEFNEKPEVGDSSFTHFSLSNNGFDTLFITDIISDNPNFRVWSKNFALAPNSGWSNVITYKPTNAGKEDATLKIIAKNNKYGNNNTVKVYAEALPTKFALNQNYPNPFNPSTVISYDLPNNGFVELKVYDILGKEVANLVNEEQQSGNYKVEFNASSFSSGIYFYRVVSGNNSMIRKMVLLR